ncbi:MAG TPA: class I SAM-dependent methyltransferase [Thermoanaerobaculia bacterium]|nr:class I SAM-dependent methyltransferase [Thermoanaerobaculia bacterium]
MKRFVRETAETSAVERRFGKLENEIAALRSRLGDAETAAGQWASLLRREAELAPPPPPHLQVRVAGKYAPGFFDSAAEACREVDVALGAAGRRLADFESILDFGCGPGRAVRILRGLAPRAHLFGADIDPEAIAWARSHYASYGDFSVAPHHPPTLYAEDRFDFILGISVFTHLPEDMQFEWLAELRRIAKPGGFLVLTTHGEEHYGKLDTDVREIMRARGFFYGDFGWNYGRSVSLPDFYQTAYHSHDYIRREWSRFFEIVEIRALGLERHQDTVLLRRPG